MHYILWSLLQSNSGYLDNISQTLTDYEHSHALQAACVYFIKPTNGTTSKLLRDRRALRFHQGQDADTYIYTEAFWHCLLLHFRDGGKPW